MKTQEAPHTPTPWQLKDNDEIVGANNGKVLEYLPYEGLSFENEIDAAYICRCVNAYEGLLEALKIAREMLFAEFKKKQGEAFVKGMVMDLWPEIKTMNEAIAAAEPQ